MAMNLLSILKLLGAGQEAPGAENPLSQAPVTGPAQTANPAQMPGMDPRVATVLANTLAGRAAISGRAAGNPQFQDTAAIAGLQALAPHLKANQDAALAQAAVEASQRGVAAFRDKVAQGDWDAAEAMLPTFEAAGMKVNAMQEIVKAGRLRKTGTDLVAAVEASTLAPPTKAAIVAGLKSGSIDPKVVVEMIQSRVGEQEKATADANKPVPLAANASLVRPTDGSVITTAPAPPEKPVVTKVTAEQIGAINSVAYKTGFRATEETRFSEIPDSVWGAIREQKRAETAADKAALMEAARIGRDNDPAPPTILARTFDAKTLQPLQGVRSNRVVNEGIDSGRYITADPKDVVQAREARNLMLPLDDVERIAKKLLAIAPGQNLANAMKLALARGLATDDDARVMEAYKDSLGLRIGAVWNKGRPTKADAEAAAVWLPRPTDTVSGALARVHRLRWMLQSSDDILLGKNPRAYQDPSAAPSGRPYQLPPR